MKKFCQNITSPLLMTLLVLTRISKAGDISISNNCEWTITPLEGKIEYPFGTNPSTLVEEKLFETFEIEQKNLNGGDNADCRPTHIHM